MYLNEMNDDLVNRRQTWLWDDFLFYLDTYAWTKGGSGNATNVPTGLPNGILQVKTNTSANGEAWVSATNLAWQFAAGKPLIYEARINYQEANVNQAGIFMGFSSAFATGLLQNTTLVPATSFYGAGIYKQAGDTTWRLITSNGTDQSAFVGPDD
jgi:hypothetical protein